MENPLESESLKLLPSLCEQALESAKQFEYSTFGVQTLFEKKKLAEEEFYFDKNNIDGCMALKNIVNSKAFKYLEKKSKKKSSNQPDVILKLDFRKNIGFAQPTNIYIFGRYLKKSREYCQHIWTCNACHGRGCKKCDFKKENYPSLEGSFAKTFMPVFEAERAKLHASGREDVDVMTLGNGRPFILELINPKKRNVDLKKLAAELEANFPIEAHGMHFCPHFWIETVCTSHFDKHYRATISCDERALGKSDFELIKSKIEVTLNQRTPVRVVKRRADLLRHRRVYSFELCNIVDGRLIVDIWAEAGTYIKELIHGDTGRTNPSVSSILHENCQCAQLDVIGIDAGFIRTLRKN